MNSKTLFGCLFAVAFMAGCAAETSEPAANDDDTSDSADQTDDLTAKLLYADVSSIIDSTCGGCHAGFKSLAGIKPSKSQMSSMIKAGEMPKGNPTWKSSADGKKVLKWLKSGADLK